MNETICDIKDIRREDKMLVTQSDPVELKLTDLSTDAFNAIVNQDVRGELDDSTASLLRKPENVERWYSALVSMKRSVEAQMTANRAERAQRYAEFIKKGESGRILLAQSRSQAGKWRQGATRFRNGLEDRIAEAKLLRGQHRSESGLSALQSERRWLVRQNVALVQAIQQHKLKVTANPDDSEDADEELWSMIDRYTPLDANGDSD